MELDTPLDVICRIVVRARQWEAQVPGADPENDDPVDDADDKYDALEDEMDDTLENELREIIDDLADDQQAEVLALALVGRGTYDASEWSDALDEANDNGGEDVADQLLEMPTLSADLEAGLAAFELSCAGIGQID